ncbi:MAG: formyltransferase family protein [Acidimicrobiales bacterium]|jgi:phosphoribosylglycinamide formyltransferase-1
MPVAVLASGEGTTAEALIRSGLEGQIGCEVGLVISSNENAGILARVKRVNDRYGSHIATACIGRRSHPPVRGESLGPGDQSLAEVAAIESLLSGGEFQVVVLMGYLRRVAPSLVNLFGWRDEYTNPYEAQMLNIHPGPLPETAGLFGIAVQRHVLMQGLGRAGHVVHVVAVNYDSGPVVFEHRTPVLSCDTPETLFERIKLLQREHVPAVVDAFATGRRHYLAARSARHQLGAV